ncbi:hypothetical protein BKA69DRAFT_1125601 [Paraphysoderma sedebokerense]|nr:hypothetical protein BKA69DRAFT_1125601 [Paraphysoderma sedebokerense]
MIVSNFSLILALLAVGNSFTLSNGIPVAEPIMGTVAVNVVGGVVSGLSGAMLGHRLAKSSEKKEEQAETSKPVRSSSVSKPTQSNASSRTPESIMIEAERKLQEAEKIKSELQAELEFVRRERRLLGTGSVGK